MVGGLWRLVRHGLAGFRWPLAGLVAMLVVLACLLVIPQWLVRWELGAAAHALTPADKARAINDVRATLLQGIGGAVLLLGAYLTYRQLQTGREQLQIAQQGQVTERFTRAIDQLGHAEQDIRLGGIYALERIANDSPDDRATIAEVLTAFIRGHAPWPPRLPGQYLAGAPIRQVPELRERARDVQAALTVLGRRQPPLTPNRPLDLRATDLRKALLDRANLQGVLLDRANLQGANLNEADLEGVSILRADLQEAQLHRANLQWAQADRAKLQAADLTHAQLQGAILRGAQLQDADFSRANLQRARLDGAQVQEVYLIDSQLQGAHLIRANLQRADLRRANLDGASLNRADLQEACLIDAQLQGTRLFHTDLNEACLHGANLKTRLEDAYLRNARADGTTTWPDNFEPRDRGVVLNDPHPDTLGDGFISPAPDPIGEPSSYFPSYMEDDSGANDPPC